MEDLAIENEKLKKENERLRSLLRDTLAENKYLTTKVREEEQGNPCIQCIAFKKSPKPTLLLDRAKVEFKSSNSNTVRLLEALFVEKEMEVDDPMLSEDYTLRATTIDRMRGEIVSIDELYDLIHSDDIEGDWFSLTQEGREKAKSEVRQIFRNINDEVKGKLKGEKLFIAEGGGFRINKSLLRLR